MNDAIKDTPENMTKNFSFCHDNEAKGSDNNKRLKENVDNLRLQCTLWTS